MTVRIEMDACEGTTMVAGFAVSMLYQVRVIISSIHKLAHWHAAYRAMSLACSS